MASEDQKTEETEETEAEEEMEKRGGVSRMGRDHLRRRCSKVFDQHGGCGQLHAG